MQIPFVDIGEQHRGIIDDLIVAGARVLRSGSFILGEEVEGFEREFSAYVGAEHAVGVNSGTDALVLALRAFAIGSGDEVITAPNSFLASASAIALAGADVRFADVGADANLDPADLELRITPRTKAVVVVHLAGRPAPLPELMEVCDRHGLRVIEDCAQAIGARLGGRHVGTFGDAGCFSLHPLKTLNACGDGGVVITKHASAADWLRRGRNHGLRDRDTCDFWSINSRLDALQAALLRVKLPLLEGWTETRIAHANRYRRGLADATNVELPAAEVKGMRAVYHSFMIRHPQRDSLRKHLAARGIDTKVHYPVPIHLQPAAAKLEYRRGDFPNCEAQCDTILSLPVHQGLTDPQVDAVIDGVAGFGS